MWVTEGVAESSLNGVSYILLIADSSDFATEY